MDLGIYAPKGKLYRLFGDSSMTVFVPQIEITN
jgi:hypothetical protein